MSGASLPGQWGLCASARPGLGRGLVGMRTAAVRKGRPGWVKREEEDLPGQAPDPMGRVCSRNGSGKESGPEAQPVASGRQGREGVLSGRREDPFLRDFKICPLLGMGVWQFSKGPDVWLRLETQGHGPGLVS